MASTPVVLILGAGPRIGASVAEKFASKGYKVAVASRKGTDSTTPEGFYSIKADFADPESIVGLFKAVKSQFNAAPSVVIYNAPSLTPPPAQDSIFSIPAARFTHDLKVNTIAAYAAAQEAVAGWASLPKEGKKSFIYTGNMLNVAVLPVPLMVDLGVGKAASAYWIGVADATLSAKGYRFFYADERAADGKMKGMQLDGPAHAEFYAQLADQEKTVPWHATFVKDQGYTKF